MRMMIFAGALAAAAALSGCNVSPDQVNAVLAITCPINAALTPMARTNALTPTEKSAVATLAAVCPPNPAPVDLNSIGQDIVAAEPVVMAALSRLFPARAEVSKAQMRALLARDGQRLRLAIRPNAMLDLQDSLK